MMKVDLFLGGTLGLWVLDQVDAQTIGAVFTSDIAIVKYAEKLGIKPNYPNPHKTVGFCMHYPAILAPSVVKSYEVIYNIHPGLLPYGRCYYPVFWALWNNEPAGCTLHVIDEGIDTGPIVAQREVPKYDWDTGGTLHERVSEAEKGLFTEYWQRIIDGEEPIIYTQWRGGTFHLKRDFFELKRRAKYHEMPGSEVLRLVRCLSHKQYSGLEVTMGGRRYEISAKEIVS
jgi:methionyl-tRNA formyltransferase